MKNKLEDKIIKEMWKLRKYISSWADDAELSAIEYEIYKRTTNILKIIKKTNIKQLNQDNKMNEEDFNGKTN